MAPQPFRHRGVRVAVLAAGEEVPPAHEALAAGDAERHHDAVAGREIPYSAPGLDDLAHELMAQDGAARVDDGRVRHLLDPDGPLAFPAGRLHDTPPALIRTSVQRTGRAGRGFPSTVASEWTTSPSSSTCLRRRRT